MAVPGPVRHAAASRPVAAMVSLLERLVPARPDSLAALTFHRVAPDGPDVVPGLLSATPDGFAALLDALRARHRIVGIDEVLRRARGGAALPGRSLLLTFDDAYVDFAEHAWPALRARGLPAILFVPTAYPDAPDAAFWWERLFAAVRTSPLGELAGPDGPLPLSTPATRQAAYRRLRASLKVLPHDEMLRHVDGLVATLGAGPAGRPESAASAPSAPATVLGWDALRRLRSEGVALAPHTRTHPLLTRLPAERRTEEIAGSREDLARETGSDLPVLAYPSGATSPDVAATVRACGIEVAFTTARGVNPLRSANWLALRRVNVSVRTPTAIVRAQVLR